MVCTRNNSLCIFGPLFGLSFGSFLSNFLDHYIRFITLQIEFKPFVSWMFKIVSFWRFFWWCFGQFLDRSFVCHLEKYFFKIVFGEYFGIWFFWTSSWFSFSPFLHHFFRPFFWIIISCFLDRFFLLFF